MFGLTLITGIEVATTTATIKNSVAAKINDYLCDELAQSYSCVWHNCHTNEQSKSVKARNRQETVLLPLASFFDGYLGITVHLMKIWNGDR